MDGPARAAVIPCARAIALALALFASACRAVEVSPATIRDADVPAEVRADVIARWSEAVAIANEFLASPFRCTLPAGSVELGDDGMRFVSTGRAWPLRVECTTWGDLCVATGFTAQERSFGFVVGSAPPGRDRRVDNSFFRDSDGEARSTYSIAGTLLHEATHVIHADGTIGVRGAIAYYLEAIFLFRYADHSAERRPMAASEEFRYFVVGRDLPVDERDELLARLRGHIAAGPTKRCRHESPPDGAP